MPARYEKTTERVFPFWGKESTSIFLLPDIVYSKTFVFGRNPELNQWSKKNSHEIFEEAGRIMKECNRVESAKKRDELWGV